MMKCFVLDHFTALFDVCLTGVWDLLFSLGRFRGLHVRYSRTRCSCVGGYWSDGGWSSDAFFIRAAQNRLRCPLPL